MLLSIRCILMTKKLKILPLTISILILVVLIVYSNPEKFFRLIAGSNFVFIGIAFVISNINLLIRVLKWYVLLDNVSFFSLAPVQFFGMTASNLSPGKIAEPLKSVVLKAYRGIPVSLSLPSVVWERTLEVVVLLILSAAGMLFFLKITDKIFWISAASFLVFGFLIVFVLLFLYNTAFRHFMFRIFRKFPVMNRITKHFISNFERSKIKKRRMVYSFTASLAAWLIDGLVIYFSLLAVGVQINPLALTCIFAVSTIIGIITFLPGGLGSTDAVMIFFLTTLNIDYTVAVAGVLISRFLSIWYTNLLGGASLIYLVKKTGLNFKNIYN